jgi:hypothetical protein
MGWLAFFGVLTLVGAAGVVVNVNRLRWDHRVSEEARGVLATEAPATSREEIGELPAPVARYRQIAVGARNPVASVRMRHGGTFRPSPQGKPMAIRGEQVFTVSPPGFVWTGRIRMAPGIWIDARDMLRDGKGSMRVLFDDTLRVADVAGDAIDRGAAVRFLAEMPWFPTALFDSRYVQWTAVDSRHAKATLRLPSLEVSCVFEFGDDGLPARAIAERPRETGELRPWGGTYGDYRIVAGMRVPFEAQVTWQLAEGPFTYAHWRIESIEYAD